MSYFAQLIESLADMARSIDWEAVAEMDDSPLPGQFKDWLTQGGEILKAMAVEEVDELLADLSKTATGNRKPETENRLLKAGARHSKADQDHIQAVHDLSVDLGADCPTEKVVRAVGEGLKPPPTEKPQAATPVPQDLEKTIQAKDEELAKIAADLDAAQAGLAKVTGEKEVLAAEVERLKAEPTPPKGALKAVPKEADGLTKTTEADPPRTALEEISLARQKPFLIR